MRRSAAAIAVAAAVLLTTGCGGGGPATISPDAPTPTATATDETTMLPRGWPAGLQLPDGAEVTSSSNDGGRLSVTFQSSELGKGVVDFLDKQITAAGFQKASSSVSGDALTADYSDGARTLDLNVVETVGDTTGTLLIAEK